MFSGNILNKYAKLAIKMGVNVQKGQTLVVNAPVFTNDLVEQVVLEGYKAGAKRVIVNYTNEHISRLHYEYQDNEVLKSVADYEVDAKVLPLKDNGCVLHIISEIPDVMNGISPKKIQEVGIARQKRFEEVSELTMANRVQWSIIGYPNVIWAKKAFPKDTDAVALKKLGDAILDSVQVLEDNDPIAWWENHNKELDEHVQIMNKYNFKELHFTNDRGTDLVVGLVKNHIWAGGSDYSAAGIEFGANMPTEEVFCMPYKFGVNGRVVSTKPLSYNGSLIDEFTLTFKDGKVIDYQAVNNQDSLQSLIEFDEGSSYIGEIALVPFHSPISMSNILFYNTLYDENASCHIALGRAYPTNVKGGAEMSQEELDAVGANNSMTHVDFMFGSEDMHIVGVTHDGEEVVVFEKGDFVF